ncbi:MAG: DUF1800 family protein [Candidatus Hydrogenedentota bacterium]
MPLLDTYTGIWDLATASHLLRRAGFGGSRAERDAVAAITLSNAVEELVNFQSTDPYLDGPTQGTGVFYGAPFVDLPTAEPTDPQDEFYWATLDLYHTRNFEWASDMRNHWLYRMRYSSQPFQEQLALFLHDHAPSGLSKVRDTIPFRVTLGNDGDPDDLLPQGEVQECTSGTLPYDPSRRHTMAMQALLDQTNLYRTEGINSFEDFLLSIIRDPAMLVYLDNFLNVKGRPQENLAREMMELFSLGVGNYSELDIFEIAKSITGEGFPDFTCENDYDASSGFVSGNHEPGNKTVFGQTVSEDMTGLETVEVVNLIVNKNHGLNPPYDHLPVVAVHMSWKILTWFVHSEIQLSPPDPIVLELADYMVGNDNGVYPQRRYPYDFKATFGKLFRSEFFYDFANRNNLYKTPADFVVGAMKSTEAAEQNYTIQAACVGMGMTLYEPPNVAGWLHDKNWLSSTALIARYNFADELGQHLQLDWSLFAGNPAWIDALPVAYNDHAGMIPLIGDLLFHEPLTTEETTTLTTFLDDLPISDISGWNEGQKRRKIGSLVHVMMTMPAYQLK